MSRHLSQDAVGIAAAREYATARAHERRARRTSDIDCEGIVETDNGARRRRNAEQTIAKSELARRAVAPHPELAMIGDDGAVLRRAGDAHDAPTRTKRRQSLELRVQLARFEQSRRQ